jgi:cell pole-organizing protein PopZ
MVTSTGNAAEKLPELDTDQEPSMEEILASIRQIIADDEEPADDGLSERERYTHPTDHSNANVVEEEADVEESDIETAMAAEMEAMVAEEAPLTIEQKAAELRVRGFLPKNVWKNTEFETSRPCQPYQ